MMLTLGGGGQAPVVVSLAPDEAWRLTRGERQAIGVPSGFSWQEDGARLLLPRYG